MSAQPANTKKRASVIPNLDTPQQTAQVDQQQARPAPTSAPATTTTPTPLTQPQDQAKTTIEALDAEPVQSQATATTTTPPATAPAQEPAPTPSPDPATSTATPATSTTPSTTPTNTTPVAPTTTSSHEKKPAPPTPTYGEIPLEKKNSQLYHIGIALFIIILGLTGILLYLRGTATSQQAEQTEEIVATPVPTEAPTPEPTPEIVQLEKSEITLEILNGTGVAGLAGSTSTTFENLGYTVESVGNADDTDANQLIVASKYAEQIEPLLEDVKSELGITKITQEDDDLNVVARIIIGEAP